VRVASILALPVLLACLVATDARAQQGSASALDSPEDPRRLVVTVVTRNDRGKVFCALWRGPQGYPTQRRHAVGQTRVRSIVNRRADCVFEDVSPGEYAVAAFHDENANNDLDRGLFGIPTEGTGASNDARGFMGPPRYDDARFQYPDVREHRITIRIGY
jgi:uncharacterized protein (DUF2141 family)